jgi:hypothetical protein
VRIHHAATRWRYFAAATVTLSRTRWRNRFDEASDSYQNLHNLLSIDVHEDPLTASFRLAYQMGVSAETSNQPYSQIDVTDRYGNRAWSASRRILTVCSSVNRVFFMTPSPPREPSSQRISCPKIGQHVNRAQRSITKHARVPQPPGLLHRIATPDSNGRMHRSLL